MNQTGNKATELLEALDSPDRPTIRAAVEALIPLAADSSELCETLEQLLHDEQRKNRWALAYILAHLAQPSSKTIETLLDGLDHREPDIRWAIGLLIVRLARMENKIVQSLSELCATGSSAQKRMAVYCLRDLNLDDENSLQVFLELLHDPDPTVRVAAVISLTKRTDLDTNGKQLLLRLYLDDPDFRVRNSAAITLSRLGSPSEEFLAALREANECENAQARKAASSALAILINKKVRSMR
jgi:HEAT repeat protein